MPNANVIVTFIQCKVSELASQNRPFVSRPLVLNLIFDILIVKGGSRNLIKRSDRVFEAPVLTPLRANEPARKLLELLAPQVERIVMFGKPDIDGFWISLESFLPPEEFGELLSEFAQERVRPKLLSVQECRLMNSRTLWPQANLTTPSTPSSATSRR